jgi:PAS domain S-box-containing protein
LRGGAIVDDALTLNDRFWRLFEAVPNGVLAFDGSGRITLVNAQAEKIFGYAREELKGQSCELLVPMRLRKSHARLCQEFRAAPQARLMGRGRQLTALRKDGSEVVVEIGLNHMATVAGDAVVATVIDVTALKRDPVVDPPLSDLLQRLFALTPAEARVAELIGSGISPRKAAEKLRISEGNARTTLKHAYRKVGVSRQSELAVVLTKLRPR